MENRLRTDIEETIAYYDHNAATFVKSTVNADVSELYKPFEELLNPGAKILDLGCGSGRDSKYFFRHGYDVVAVDPSQAMCEQTRTMDFSNEFDAVWACASLLHISRDMYELTFNRIMESLKDGGIIYSSWKYGYHDRYQCGRTFTDMNEISLNEVINNIPGLVLLKMWVTYDVRPGEHKVKWLNALMKKK